MLITNTQNVAYWFGPMYLPAGNTSTLTIDDTTDTGLYLIDDTVAEAVNSLALSGMITVTPGTGSPYPRPTGVPAVLHGDGSPNGLIYAPQGSLYLRRDNTGASTCLYAKTTGVDSNIGWTAVSADANAAPTGVIQAYGGAAAPTGWLLCDNSAVSRTTQSSLFGVIGTTYGAGDGSTTFNVPDLRGRVPVGYAASDGHADVSTLGNNEGSTEANRRPKHPHTNGLSVSSPVTDPGHSHAVYHGPSGAYDDNSSGDANAHYENATYITNSSQGIQMIQDSTTGITVTTTLSGSIGASGTANDAPAYLVLNYIIKT